MFKFYLYKLEKHAEPEWKLHLANSDQWTYVIPK